MLESLIENKFYQKETRVFLPDYVAEDTGSEQFLDETISRMIENIRMDDMTHLWEHFRILKNGMGELSSYSQIYTRFLFSNLVKEFFTHQHQDRKKLETAVQKVYEMQSVQEVISLVETLIQNMEERLAANNDGARNEVAQAKSYIYEHYSEDISVEKLSELVYLSPGYFSYIFKKETGDTVSRFIRNYRMEQAKKLLSDTSMKIVQICKETGFSNVSYFCKNFREYCGCSPEQYRKGGMTDAQTETVLS